MDVCQCGLLFWCHSSTLPLLFMTFLRASCLQDFISVKFWGNWPVTSKYICGRGNDLQRETEQSPKKKKKRKAKERLTIYWAISLFNFNAEEKSAKTSETTGAIYSISSWSKQREIVYLYLQLLPSAPESRLKHLCAGTAYYIMKHYMQQPSVSRGHTSVIKD